MKFYKSRFACDIRKYCFPQRAINEWNNLDNDVIESETVIQFKNKIDEYMKAWGLYKSLHFLVKCR